MAQAFNDKIEDGNTRPQFGTRFLTEEQNVFQHNACGIKWLHFTEVQTDLSQVSPVVRNVARRFLADRPSGGGRWLPPQCSEAYLLHNNWDNVVWDAEQEEEAKQKTLEQAAHALSKDEQEKYDSKADQFWDDFYSIHQNRFFKDRHWLFTEFPELNCSHLATSYNDTVTNDLVRSYTTDTDYPGANAKYRFLEVGCGVGNTVFPVVQTNNNPELMVYCCDFSATGVKHVKEHPDYDPYRCHAFVCDIAKPDSPVPFPDASLDIIIMIFVLSAINPDKIPNVIERLVRYLKPGGLLLFRDYGRYDMAQLRFKKGRCLGENFYVRGDGTRVYFFEQEELRQLFTKAGLIEEQNLIDRRLQVNRGKQLKMYRVWIQCKYRKPIQQQSLDASS